MGHSAQDEGSNVRASVGNLLRGFPAAGSAMFLPTFPAAASASSSASSRIRALTKLLYMLKLGRCEGPDDGSLSSDQKAVITGPGGYLLFSISPHMPPS